MPAELSRNVGRLPSNLPGEFNSLRRSSFVQRINAAGSLPSKLPGNFNNIVPPDDIPYGSIGFTLICRSASDFTTILGIFYDYQAMSFTEELSGPGAGSVTFDLEDTSFLNQLVSTNDPEAILEKDNLWEVYFDGKRRFMWRGLNVNESELNPNEDNTVTISGPGLASSLEWAKVLPNRFPTPMPKIETIQDDFVDVDVDLYGKWVGTIVAVGSVSAANSAVALTVTGTGSPGTQIASDFAYDFEESAVSAWVQPSTAGTGSGYIKTALRIEQSANYYVGMATIKDTVANQYVLIAEVTDPDGTYTKQQVPYNSNNMRYWRIQEKDGTAIFSYKAVNATDDQWITFAQLPYKIVPTQVRLNLLTFAVAGTGLTLPQKSSFTHINLPGVASAHPPLEKYRRLILKAQNRGTIRHVIPDWNEDGDSMGAAWVDNTSSDVSLGADLLSVLDDYCASNRADWLFTADYRLQIRQRVYVQGPGIPDPTAPYHKEDKVILYEAQSQLNRQRTRTYQDVANYLVSATANDEYAVVKDDTSILNYQQREDLVSDTLKAVDMPSLQASLRNQLESRKEGKSSWTLEVAYDVESVRLYDDYVLGDWVSVQSAQGPQPRLDSWRIAAISVQVAGEDDPKIELTLNEKLDPYWIKLEKTVKKNKWTTIPTKPRQL